MSGIRSRDNRSTELAFVALLQEFGIRGWRRHYRLPGKPDFAFPQASVAVFIDGCFWHQCPRCYDGHLPKENSSYWGPKLARNKRRDRRNTETLRKLGWRVFRIRECSITKRKPTLFCSLAKINQALRKAAWAKRYRTRSNRAA